MVIEENILNPPHNSHKEIEDNKLKLSNNRKGVRFNIEEIENKDGGFNMSNKNASINYNSSLRNFFQTPKTGLISNSPVLNHRLKLMKNNTIIVMQDIREKQLTCWEILRSIFLCCRSKRITKRINFTSLIYKKLLIKFDWIHFLKFQNEQELIKNVVFNKEQGDILTLCMKLNKNSNLYVYIIYNLLLFI